MKRRYCFTLDLKDDPALIAEYKPKDLAGNHAQHQRRWDRESGNLSAWHLN
jgi:hypothetical protein